MSNEAHATTAAEKQPFYSLFSTADRSALLYECLAEIKANSANNLQMADYTIRLARAEDLTLLAPIEQSAASLFQNTPYAFLVSAEPLPLEFVQQGFGSFQCCCSERQAIDVTPQESH